MRHTALYTAINTGNTEREVSSENDSKNKPFCPSLVQSVSRPEHQPLAYFLYPAQQV